VAEAACAVFNDAILRHVISLCALLAFFSPARRSEAQAVPRCDAQAEHWLAVEVVGLGWPPVLSRLVLGQLEASFRGLNLATCAPGARADPPLAHITLRTHERERVEVSVDIRDAVTNKRVGRNIDVARLDDQATALALAVSVDELVRATWAELALEGYPESPAPPVVERVVEGSLRDPAMRWQARSGLSAEAAIELFGVGDVFLGGDVVFWRRMAPSIGLEIALGGRRGLGATTALGRVETSAASGRLALPIVALDAQRWELFAAPSAQALFVSTRGEPRAEAIQGQQDTGLAVLGRLDVVGRLRLSRHLDVSLRLGGGHTLLGTPVLAGDQQVAGAYGFVLAGALGAGAMF
jgi:hypothetical protein